MGFRLLPLQPKAEQTHTGGRSFIKNPRFIRENIFKIEPQSPDTHVKDLVNGRLRENREIPHRGGNPPGKPPRGRNIMESKVRDSTKEIPPVLAQPSEHPLEGWSDSG